MVDPALSIVSDEERRLAVDLLHDLMEAVGDQHTRHVSAVDIHRVLAFVAAIVVEADSELTDGGGFLRLGLLIGDLIAYHARKLRMERQQTGSGLTELGTARRTPKCH